MSKPERETPAGALGPGDYKTAAGALAAAVSYVSRDGGRKVADYRLLEASFGRRSNLAGPDGGYYFVLRYAVEVQNGEVPEVRQTTEDQIERVVQAWAYTFTVARREEEPE